MSESAERPSKKQRELLSFIDGFIAGHGYGPSYREIMRSLNYKSVSTVATHVDNLIAKGHLIKKDNSARSLEVVSPKTIAVVQVVATKSQSKWLVDQVNQRFETYQNEPTQKGYDELCILVGALSVLGLDEAAIASKAKLTDIVPPTKTS